MPNEQSLPDLATLQAQWEGISEKKIWGGKRKLYCDDPQHRFLRIKVDDNNRQCLGCKRIYKIADEPAPVVKTPEMVAAKKMQLLQEQRQRLMEKKQKVYSSWLA